MNNAVRTPAFACFLVVLSMAACGQKGSPAPPLGRDGSPNTQEDVWLLVEGKGPEGRINASVDDIVLEIAGNRVRGGAACNSYDGQAQIDGTRFRISDVAVTEVGCKKQLHRIDEAYFAALTAVDTIEREGRELTLRGSQTLLFYELVPPPPDAPLVGTSWQIDSLLYGQGPDGWVSSATPASLRLGDDGTMSGSTGCRPFTARWKEEGNEILVEEFLPSGNCEEPHDRDQDQHLTSILGERFRFEIQGMRFEVLDEDGQVGAYYYAPCRLEPELRCRL